MMQKLLNAVEVAGRLCVSTRQARRLMEEMHPVDIGTGSRRKALRVRPCELNAYIQRKSVRAEEPAAPPPKRPKLTLYTTEGLVNGRIPYDRPAQTHRRASDG